MKDYIERDEVLKFLSYINSANHGVILRLGGSSEVVTLDEIIEAIEELPVVQLGQP